MPLLSRRQDPLSALLALDTPLDAPSRGRRTSKDPLTFGVREPVVEPVEDEWTTRDYLAAGTRGLGGLFGVTPLTGAAAGAGSEVLAQLIEGENPLSGAGLTEIGAATALGATGGKLAKTAMSAAGPLRAMLSAAPWAAAQPFISSGIREGELPSMEDVGWSTAIGAGTAGATSGLLHMLGAKIPKGGQQGTPKPTFELEQTRQMGKDAVAAGPYSKTVRGTGEVVRPVGGTVPVTADPRVGAYPDAGGMSPRAAQAVEADRLAREAAEAAQMAEMDNLINQANIDAAKAKGLVPTEKVTETVKATGLPGQASTLSRVFAAPKAAKEATAPGVNVQELRHAAAAEDKAWAMVREEAEAAKAAEELAALKASLDPQTPSVSESISTRVPGGPTTRATTRFVDEAALAAQAEEKAAMKAEAAAEKAAARDMKKQQAHQERLEAKAEAQKQKEIEKILAKSRKDAEAAKKAAGQAPPAAETQNLVPAEVPGAAQIAAVATDAKPLTATLGEMLGAKGTAAPTPIAAPPQVSAPPAARSLDELLGVAERRSGERTPEMDEFFAAERGGVNPLGAQGPAPRTAAGVSREVAAAEETAGPVIAPIREMSAGETQGVQKLGGLLSRHGDDYVPPSVTGTGGELTAEELAAAAAIPHGRTVAGSELDDILGVVERRSAQRDPLLDEAFQAERAGVNPLELAPPAPAAPEAPATLATLFKSPGQAAGQHYANLKAIFGAGASGLPQEVVKDVQKVAQNRVAGQAAGRLRQAEGLPKEALAPNVPGLPEVPPTAAPKGRGFMDRLRSQGSTNVNPRTPMTPEQFQETLRAIDAQKGRPGAGPLGPGGLGSKAGGEGGFADPKLLAHMFLGSAGGLIGGAMDPLGDPIMSALAGTAIGAAIPTLASKAMAIGPMIEQNTQISPDTKTWMQTLMTPEGFTQNVRDVVKAAPNMMRGNVLMSPNLINNAGVGPWAMGVHGALERIAMGDPDGWRFLAELRPDKWAQRAWTHRQEAGQMVGDWERAGGQMLGEAGNAIEQVATIPGMIMTGGDLATRKPAAELWGEKVARRMTGTDEPEYLASKKLLDLQRSGPLMQTLFPFARTLVNLGEEGLQRTPVIGSIAQSMRPNPDAQGLQLLKQALGGGSIAGGYLAGQNMDALTALSPMDDNTEMRFLRNFFSNLAGPNAVLANAGLAAGMASDLGKTPTQQLGTGLIESMEDVPLPSWDPITSWGKVLTAEPGSERVPSGVLPSFIRDYINQGLEGAGSGNRAQAGNKPQPKRER